MKKDLLKFNNRITQKKIKVIYNPINDKEIIDKSKKTDFDLNKFIKMRYILFVGRLERVKNLDLLIILFNEINKKINKINLIIIGDGAKKKELLNIINRYKLDKKISLLGFKDNPYPFILNAEIIISTSYYEGYSNIILESIILKKKLFVSNVPGGNSEIFSTHCKDSLFDLKKISNRYIDDISKKLINIINNEDYNFEIKQLNNEIINKHNFVSRLNDFQKELDE